MKLFFILIYFLLAYSVTNSQSIVTRQEGSLLIYNVFDIEQKEITIQVIDKQTGIIQNDDYDLFADNFQNAELLYKGKFVLRILTLDRKLIIQKEIVMQ